MKLLLLCAFAACAAYAGVLQEYEGFNYPNGTLLVTGPNGGTGWSTPWGGFGLDGTVQNGALTTAGSQPTDPPDGSFVASWFRSRRL